MNLITSSTRNELHRASYAVYLAILTFVIASTFQVDAYAQATTFNFPIIDNFMCGLIAWFKGKLAPVMAVLIIICTVVGHWLGMLKMWGTLFFVGVGLGVIVGIGSIVASAVPGIGTSCLT
jgi:type IV secretory pathway VirB2 component (pilin)